MKIYIKPLLDHVWITYRKLAEMMWFQETDQKHLEISHVGNDESLQNNFYLTLKLDKDLNDRRWQGLTTTLKTEFIEMEKEADTGVIVIETTHKNILSVDKRALYIMVIEIAKETQGEISTDERKTWMTPDEFIENNKTILNLSYNEANEISLKEAETMEAIDEPWEWDETE